MGEWVDGWKDGWVRELMDGRIDKQTINIHT